jgi:hypothetical protein
MTTISKSTDTPNGVSADAPGPSAPAAPGTPEGPGADKKARDHAVAAKRVATIARNKEASRVEQLAHMASQVSDGSLVIRQMTPTERETDLRQRR